ncbi:hypothetical protein [Dyella sp. 20L07]|uniref:hypothetical protein n=1 Tax=Dyella sp. 20L07 TaxID=3384240 RepID=UPI003D2E2295
MAAPLGRSIAWLSSHPHTIVSLMSGVALGIALTFPLGWRLGDPSALVGAAIGAAAAVGGALWAANAKQRQEDARSDSRQRDLATMVAAAIAPEIISATKNLRLIAARLTESIAKMDDGGDIANVTGVLSGAKLDSAMCLLFIDKLDSFGRDASPMIEAVGAILDSNSSHSSLVEPLRHVEWVTARDVIVTRAKLAVFYANNIETAVHKLADYHPRGKEILKQL